LIFPSRAANIIFQVSSPIPSSNIIYHLIRYSLNVSYYHHPPAHQENSTDIK
jgi:hypothetical protein